MRLDGQVVALTGAGGLLGRALATRLAAEGAAALLLADRDSAALRSTLDGFDHGATAVRSLAVDVTVAGDVDRLVDRALTDHGRLDVMINNAGVISRNARIHNLTAQDWRAVFDVNLFGVLHGLHSALRVMRPRRQGSIINTASVAGLTAWPYAAPYGVSKAAVIQLTKVAAVEYARDNIRVNCVCPGVFPSSMHKDLPASAMDALAARHPLGLGSAEDVVSAFIYLASSDSRWTTGSALIVDGGYSAP
ncbi:MAG: SDR family NAD(P)-dependent oxidoreductase [Actinomycetota bacterium]|jgi:meso-butanediol dehydrogenase / (S,S)-butanediol dehydrogenase / diacetyl reductase